MAEEGRFISPFEGPRLAILVTFDAILSSKETLRIRGIALAATVRVSGRMRWSVHSRSRLGWRCSVFAQLGWAGLAVNQARWLLKGLATQI
jgi:hypothetical protein